MHYISLDDIAFVWGYFHFQSRNMETCFPRHIFLGTLIITLMVLHVTSTSHATGFASLTEKINVTATSFADSDDFDLEFLTNPDIGRMLFDFRYLISRSRIRMRPIVNCNRGNAYASCLPAKNQRIRSERCGIYKRRGCF
ncbi:putative Malectin/receptor-like protein kinase family protein [Hibiscus syriacus]|uniref:Malectin/receptor-like protein kinase family protein n=1 Tax=Hibiscus syriacus TaxID=106335 RepID=A0A6A2Z2E0_HIBSY|nr:putative Malectin/receptor-like protein kinase family protein [Hibiscus syriacus]